VRSRPRTIGAVEISRHASCFVSESYVVGHPPYNAAEDMNCTPRFHLVLTLGLASALLAVSDGRAGCLAPKDYAVEVGTGSGPLWGNDSGSLLCVRVGGTGRRSLAVRSVTSGQVDDVAFVGDATGFYVGGSSSTWDGFTSGTVNGDGDIAFVASTAASDDPNTALDESGLHRGTYARTGAALYEIARFGADSPVLDLANAPVPWGSSFDAVAADRDAMGFLSVVFSAQLAGASDHRLGLFQWRESSPNGVTPVLLTGDASPSGGTFVSIGRLRCNGPGDVAFFAVTRLTDGAPQIPGIFLLHADGTKARVVQFGTSGDAAPDGGTFGIAGDFDVDDSGVVVFAATIQNGPRKTGLFRASPPNYAPQALFGEGDETPIAGSFGSFATSVVRVNAGGEALVSVPMSDDVGGDGLFSVASGATTPTPLILLDDAVSVAAIGAGNAAYSTPTQIRVVVPEDGSDEGPTDFRIVNLDVRNVPEGAHDAITFEGRFLLPPWDVKPPATFRGDVPRMTPTASLSGASVTKIAEAKVIVSSGDGNNFTFGIGGAEAAPTGTCGFNGTSQIMKRLVVKPDGSAATWTMAGTPGPTTLAIDLAAGKFKLTVSSALIHPSYDASNFRVGFILRSADDVARSVPDDQSYFWRDFRIVGQQPSFGAGRRVTSKGEGTPGGTVFVDTLKVTRKPATGTKPATDAVQMAGVLRLCPGTVAAPAPILPATLRVGDFHLDGITLTRVGKKGISYRYAAPGVDFRLDLAKATFTLKATTPALAGLVDPVAGSATNGATAAVGGMSLPFSLNVTHVYDASFDVPMVRQKGGKVFQR
jgi:hypothetical protein